uniref:Protein DEK n=1 Tax=Anthurium amnicola TaxID=1678845 RepID=A0A1D1YZV4_9ARAE
MASPEAQEEDKSGEGPPGEEEKMSQDAVEVVVVGADGEKEAAGVDVTGGEGKRKRGRKPKGAPGAPKSEAAGKKVGKKRSSGVARPAVVRLRPTRDRKTVERFSVTSPQRGVATKAVSIQQGSGTKLKDIPNVVFKLSKRRADENLQFLHKILFAKKAKALYLKRNIYQFSGFVWTENKEKHRAKVKEKLDKCVKDKLLDFCDLLDIPVLRATTKKEEMSTKLLEFLESPHVTRDTVLAEKEQKSRKRKRSKGITESTDADADADRETKVTGSHSILRSTGCNGPI